jgi:uncharacterized protein (UPF0261 family)
MIEGTVKCALEAQAKHGFAGIIGVGGSIGTTLGSVVMQAFPYGLPKVMVSSTKSTTRNRWNFNPRQRSDSATE